MTDKEIEDIFQDAIQAHLSPLPIRIIFPNDHEAGNAYSALLERFGNDEITIQFKEIDNIHCIIYLTHNITMDTIATPVLEIYPNGLDRLKEELEANPFIGLHTVSLIYGPKGGFPTTKHEPSQSRRPINIVGYVFLV